MAVDYKVSSANARNQAMLRPLLRDPVAYSTPLAKRQDAKFSWQEVYNEMAWIVDRAAVGRAVRVKNTSASEWAAGTLLATAAALTAQTSAAASNSPTAGTSVVFLVAATFEVGQIVSIVSGGYTDFATVTAVSAGVSVTVDRSLYAHTTPTITALPAWESVLADADAGVQADWVTTAAIAAGAYGWAYDMVEVSGLDTSSYSAEDLVYLSSTAGAYTKTAADYTGADRIKQEVGVVKAAHASTGSILFYPGLKKILKFGSSALQSGGITFPALDFATAMSASQVISPTALAANTNNWAPTGLAGAMVIRASASAAYDLTGLTGGASGRVVFVHNIGAENITFKDESSSSSAANRFAMTGDMILHADEAVVLQYDATSSRWRVLSKTGDAGDITDIVTGATSGLSGGASSGAVTLQVEVDASTVEINGSNKIQVKALGIANAQIATSAAIAWSKIDKSGAAASDVGAAASSHNHAGADINSGTIDRARLPGPTIAAKTSDYDVVTADRHTVFTNEGSTGTRAFNLPTAAAGEGPFTFWLQNTTTTGKIQIKANTGDYIQYGTGTSTEAGTLTSNSELGSSVTLVAVNSTTWAVISSIGNWTAA